MASLSRSSLAVSLAMVACCAGASLWAGCHTADTSDASACGPGASADQIAKDCPEYAAARCALETKCILDPETREPACDSTEQIRCQTRLGTPSADAARVERCTTALATLSCDDYITGKLPSDCLTQPGAFADDTPCTDDSQCKSTACQFGIPASVHVSGPLPPGCGFCVPTSGAGGPCPCVPGLTCLLPGPFDETPMPTCGTPAIAGETCNATTPCAIGLLCVGDGGFVCKPPSTEGGPCDTQETPTFRPQLCMNELMCEDGGCVPRPADPCIAQCAPQACTRNFGGGVICYTPGNEGDGCTIFDRTNGARGCADGLVCDTSCSTCTTSSGFCAKPPPPPTPSSCAKQMGLPDPGCAGP